MFQTTNQEAMLMEMSLRMLDSHAWTVSKVDSGMLVALQELEDRGSAQLVFTRKMYWVPAVNSSAVQW